VTKAARFKQREVIVMMKAAQQAGVSSYDVVIGREGLPIVRVRPAAQSSTSQDILDEINEWADEA
jgi:hypothetical protein